MVGTFSLRSGLLLLGARPLGLGRMPLPSLEPSPTHL